MSGWEQAEPGFRRKAYGAIESDPQVLLECDGGPGGMDAEVYMARLLGFEDEIVQDGMRLRRAEPVILMPILRRPMLFAADVDSLDVQPMRTAQYVMQSGFALVHAAAEYAPPGVTLRPDFTFRILYLRYRRRP